MKRSFLAMLLAAMVAAATMFPDTAEARRGRGAGPFIGGLAAGAIIGGLLAAPAYAYPRRYGPHYGPYAYPYYGYGPYAYFPPRRCVRRVERHWNGYRWYRTRVLVCY